MSNSQTVETLSLPSGLLDIKKWFWQQWQKYQDYLALVDGGMIGWQKAEQKTIN